MHQTGKMRDEHKLMIQILMSKGLIGERELQDIYQKVRERCGVTDNVSLNEFRNILNPKLREVSMEIRQKPDEDTGEQMYALVQTVESDLGKLTTDYLPQQLELFKKTVGLIMGTPDGMASSTDILNLTDSLEKKMTKQDAEETLNQFVQEKWLKQNEGYVWMTGRSIMELEMYLRQTYQTDQCKNCKDIVIKGSLFSTMYFSPRGPCKNIITLVLARLPKRTVHSRNKFYQGQVCSQCEIKLHGYCADRLFKDRRRVCPNCSQHWL